VGREGCNERLRWYAELVKVRDLIKTLHQGRIATGPSVEIVKQRMAKAIEMHLAAMRADGDQIPELSRLELVEIR